MSKNLKIIILASIWITWPNGIFALESSSGAHILSIFSLYVYLIEYETNFQKDLLVFEKLEAGGKPSTWLPPERLVEHILLSVKFSLAALHLLVVVISEIPSKKFIGNKRRPKYYYTEIYHNYHQVLDSHVPSSK